MAQSSYNVPHRVELAGINYKPYGAKSLPTVSMNHDPTWEAAKYVLLSGFFLLRVHPPLPRTDFFCHFLLGNGGGTPLNGINTLSSILRLPF